MKTVLNFLRANWLKIAATVALLSLAAWWGGLQDLGIIPAAIAIIIWTK